eukprot:scaffold4731_cov70-Cylindrotheca_fusiformis.AAC.2
MYDLIIIGGGVVGCSILRAATLQGYSTCLVESSNDLLSNGASGNNSGIVCTGVDAKPGTLERALIRDAISQIRIYCQQHNVPTRPCGSLVCLWPWDDDDDDDNNNNNKLEQVLKESHDAGDTQASIWTADQVRKAEPNLASAIRGACHIPGEIVIDPWLYSISLAIHAKENGAVIHTNFTVDPQQSYFQNGFWTIASVEKKEKAAVQGKVVVNAAGIFADILQEQFQIQSSNGGVSWTAKPRRGQYRIYDAQTTPQQQQHEQHPPIITHPIQPVPSQFTKGIFVFTTLYNQLVVGPTALDQVSRTDRSIDPQTAQQLDDHVRRIIGDNNDGMMKLKCIGEYVGIRPGTNQRDYQIHTSPNQNWMVVAGIRSTGLTASLGIGNYVIRQLQCILGLPNDKNNNNKKSSNAATATAAATCC